MDTTPDLGEVTALGPPVELPFFNGPLDLLLHLIRKNQVSIYDIPIVAICDQYHEHIRTMEELDLEVAGEFLWMAAWLLQLKSRMLLPRVEEEGEDPREELVERLLAYRAVRELAAILHDKDLVRSCIWPAGVVPALDDAQTELDWEEVDLRLLAETYLAVMTRFAAANPPPLEVLPLRYTVQDKMREIYQRIVDEELVPLLRYLNRRPDPEEAVALVVATLELVRLGAVSAEQRLPFAEIYLRRGSRQVDLDRFAGETAGVSDGA
ncbi:MAG: segregation/condensation protein A [Thermoanaerobaculales bacterium]|nr:segregation/condensation protein A [Thermoanaerobaculales bacterium]